MYESLSVYLSDGWLVGLSFGWFANLSVCLLIGLSVGKEVCRSVY